MTATRAGRGGEGGGVEGGDQAKSGFDPLSATPHYHHHHHHHHHPHHHIEEGGVEPALLSSSTIRPQKPMSRKLPLSCLLAPTLPLPSPVSLSSPPGYSMMYMGKRSVKHPKKRRLKVYRIRELGDGKSAAAFVVESYRTTDEKAAGPSSRAEGTSAAAAASEGLGLKSSSSSHILNKMGTSHQLSAAAGIPRGDITSTPSSTLRRVVSSSSKGGLLKPGISEALAPPRFSRSFSYTNILQQRKKQQQHLLSSEITGSGYGIFGPTVTSSGSSGGGGGLAVGGGGGGGGPTVISPPPAAAAVAQAEKAAPTPPISDLAGPLQEIEEQQQGGGGGGGNVLFGPEENPQKEIQALNRYSKARQLRWGHLYLPALPDLYGSAPNWRSLIVPGTLPITTAYFPSAREISKKFLEYPHTVSLVPGDNDYNDNSMELLAELMCQRYNQEYQLAIVRNDFDNNNSSNANSLRTNTMPLPAPPGEGGVGGGGGGGGLSSDFYNSSPRLTPRRPIKKNLFGNGDKSGSISSSSHFHHHSLHHHHHHRLSATRRFREGSISAGFERKKKSGSSTSLFRSANSSGSVDGDDMMMLSSHGRRRMLGQRRRDNELVFKFSFRCEYQEIRYDREKDSVSIKRFVPRSRAQKKNVAKGSVVIPYRCMIWSELLQKYMLRGLQIKATHEDYNWNHTDQVIAGYMNNFKQNSKAKELAIVLLPPPRAEFPGLQRRRAVPPLMRRQASMAPSSSAATSSTSSSSNLGFQASSSPRLVRHASEPLSYYSSSKKESTMNASTTNANTNAAAAAAAKSSAAFKSWIEHVTGKKFSELGIRILDGGGADVGGGSGDSNKDDADGEDHKRRREEVSVTRKTIKIFLGERPGDEKSSDKKKSTAGRRGNSHLHSSQTATSNAEGLLAQAMRGGENKGGVEWKWGTLKRPEWFLLEFDTVYHPQMAFCLTFRWLVLSGARLREFIISSRRRAKRCGLRLVSVPVEFQAESSDMFSSPFYCPIEVPLPKRSKRASKTHQPSDGVGWEGTPQTYSVSSPSSSLAAMSLGKAQEEAALHAVKAMLNEELGFIAVYGRNLWIHQTGVAKVSWSAVRHSLYWYNNYLFEAADLRKQSRGLFLRLQNRLASLKVVQQVLTDSILKAIPY